MYVSKSANGRVLERPGLSSLKDQSTAHYEVFVYMLGNLINHDDSDKNFPSLHI